MRSRVRSMRLIVLIASTLAALVNTAGAAMKVKRGRFGEFLACSRFPDCKGTKPVSIGVLCPKPGCGGFLTAKRSRRGKIFYGCTRYPECTFAVWDRPRLTPCPNCGAPFLVEKETKKGLVLRCLQCKSSFDPEALGARSA